MDRILLARNGALGDVILASPIVRHLAKTHNCLVDVLTAFPQVFERNPHVGKLNNILPTDPYLFRFNLNMVYENNPRLHITDAYGQEVFGHQDFDHTPDLFESEQHERSVDEIVRFGSRFIVIHMRKYGWPNRNFPEKFWAKVVKRMLDETPYDIFQIGSPNEIAFSGNPRLHDTRNFNLSIHDIKVLISRANAFIGIDTGTLHIAACTKTPIVSIFTSASHEYRQPLRNPNAFFPILPHTSDGMILACYGCQKERIGSTDYYCKRGDNICTESVSPDEIVEKLVNI